MTDSIPSPTAGTVLEGALGRSRALHSNWLWVRTLGLLVDAGDGVALDMERHVGSPPVLALTHGHSDHLLGLPNLLATRQFGSMISGGPLTVLYPALCPAVQATRDYCRALWSRSTFDRISWIPMVPGDVFPVGRHRVITAFETRHTQWLPTQGYAVREQRSRLRPELVGLSPRDIAAIATRGGSSAVRTPYLHTLFAHSGDSLALDLDLLDDADCYVVDATFLDSSDRDGGTHAALDEIQETLVRRRVRTAVLHHLSQRYDRDTLVADIQARLLPGVALPRIILWDDREFLAVHPGGVIG